MAASTLALVGVNSSLTATLITYEKRSCDGSAIQYVGTNDDDTLAAPRLIDVKLDVKNPGMAGNDRVNVSIKQALLDDLGVAHILSFSGQLSIPRIATVTQDKIISLLKQHADYMGGVSATVSGQTDTSGFPADWAKLLIP